MNDSVMYSGVDGVPDGGMFGNETIDKGNPTETTRPRPPTKRINP